MKDYKTIWATKARSKSITSQDMFERCVIKAIAAKSNDKVSLLRILLARAFSPCKYRRPAYRTLINIQKYVLYQFKYFRHTTWASNILETEAEWDMYYALISRADLIMEANDE